MEERGRVSERGQLCVGFPFSFRLKKKHNTHKNSSDHDAGTDGGNDGDNDDGSGNASACGKDSDGDNDSNSDVAMGSIGGEKNRKPRSNPGFFRKTAAAELEPPPPPQAPFERGAQIDARRQSRRQKTLGRRCRRPFPRAPKNRRARKVTLNQEGKKLAPK